MLTKVVAKSTLTKFRFNIVAEINDCIHIKLAEREKIHVGWIFEDHIMVLGFKCFKNGHVAVNCSNINIIKIITVQPILPSSHVWI